jgi:hypothetical protein
VKGVVMGYEKAGLLLGVGKRVTEVGGDEVGGGD